MNCPFALVHLALTLSIHPAQPFMELGLDSVAVEKLAEQLQSFATGGLCRDHNRSSLCLHVDSALNCDPRPHPRKVFG